MTDTNYKAKFNYKGIDYEVKANTRLELANKMKDIREMTARKKEVIQVAKWLDNADCPYCWDELIRKNGKNWLFFYHKNKDKGEKCQRSTFSLSQLDKAIHSIDGKCAYCKANGKDTGLTFRRAGGIFPYNELNEKAIESWYTICVQDVYEILEKKEFKPLHYWGCADFDDTNHTYKEWAYKVDKEILF